MTDFERQLRNVFGAFPTGVAAIAGLVDGEAHGIAASSFVSVSLDPPLVAINVAHSSTTWPRIRGCSSLGISVLAAGQSCVCRQIAAGGADRFRGLAWRATAEGAVVLEGAAAWFDCTLEGEVAAGDHTIVLLHVRDLDSDPTVEPLVFHGSTYRRLAKRLEVGQDTPRVVISARPLAPGD